MCCRVFGCRPAERPKLSDPAHEGVRLQPERDGRVRCSAWLGVTGLFMGRGTTIPSGRDQNNEADQCQYDSCDDEPIISIPSAGFANLASDEEAAKRPTDYRQTSAEQLEWGFPFLGV